jgi:putative DNA methylase
VWPDIFSTVLVPKAQELIATPYRFGGDKSKAKAFFESGLRKTFAAMHRGQAAGFPMTVFYAFKQAESAERDDENSAIASTGWETMLEGLLGADLAITATWPMRTELGHRSIASGTNALASSIVLACRPRPEGAPMATRKEFLGALKKELRPALHTLQQANIAPVDLAQASIGPGMAVYSRYAKVLEPDGSPMPVRTALMLINQEMDSYLAEQEGEMDADSRFCLAWFEQYGMKEGPFGVAETLSKAKNTSVEGIVRSGCLSSKAGKVRLLAREEMSADYDPVTDDRRTVWECVQHLIKQLALGGVEAAGRLTARMGPDYSEQAKALAYRLFVICERKKWAEEALAYNSLITSWGDVQEKSQSRGTGQYRQPTLEG